MSTSHPTVVDRVARVRHRPQGISESSHLVGGELFRARPASMLAEHDESACVSYQNAHAPA